MNKTKEKIIVFFGALMCCFLWGSAFPGIKIGYEFWNIGSGETGRIIAFAGLRFFLAGILVILIGSVIRRKFILPGKKDIPKILILSFFQTIGQYVFFYVGLAHTSGVNASVINSLTSFFAILVASTVFRMERMNARKIVGCVLGFSGVIIVNLTGEGFQINFLGDGLMILTCIFYGFSSSLIKKYSENHDTVLLSGYQFVVGGLVLTLVGLPWGLLSDRGEISVSIEGVGILIYLALVSSVAYTVWGLLLRKNDVSKISIFGFMTPVMGVVLSALFLGEAGQLGIRHIVSLALVCAGIIVVE
ncbi:MAG: DMT family transporter [Eubacterium sp.]|nr:DMT family transporter [Eubacterium sp.]